MSDEFFAAVVRCDELGSTLTLQRTELERLRATMAEETVSVELLK